MSATTFSNAAMAPTGNRAGNLNQPKHLGVMSFLIVLVFALLALFIKDHGKAGQSLISEFSASLPYTFNYTEKQDTEADNAAETPAKPSELLSPRMRAVLDHVTKRYRVAAETIGPILAAAQSTGQERGLDPLLIIAVIGIESGFNPFAESSFGAQGLMQIIPRYHQDKVPDGAGEHPFLDPVTNVRIGGHVLQEAIRMRGSLTAGLQQYAGATDSTEAYATKVLAEKQRLEQAASRAPRTST